MNEKDIEKALQSLGAQIQLRDDERATMREKLETYMTYTPARARTVQSRARLRGLLDFVHTAAGHKLVAGTLVVALVFTSGVGITSAAEDALPGDALYGVKTASEEARDLLAVTQERKAEWSIERTHRRLEEAQALLVRDGLETQEEVVTEHLEKHFARAYARIDRLREHRPLLAEALEQSLVAGAVAHADALEQEEKVLYEPPQEKEAMVTAAVPETAFNTAGTHAKRVRKEEGRHRIARIARAHIRQEVRALNAGTAPVVPPAITPAVADELVQVLDRQQARLEKRIDALPETQKETVSSVLADIEEARDAARDAVQVGQYDAAVQEVREAMHSAHKARATLREEKRVDAAVSAPAAAPVQELWRFEEGPVRPHVREEIRKRVTDEVKEELRALPPQVREELRALPQEAKQEIRKEIRQEVRNEQRVQRRQEKETRDSQTR